jgi:amino acid permease
LIVLAIVSLPPFILAYSGLGSFVNALYFAGTFGGVLMGIIPILLLRNSRKYGDRTPEFTCGWYAHPAIQIMIMSIFIFSGIYAVASLLGLTPSSW